MPCHNTSDFIDKTLKKISFLLLSRNDVEIIFVDDGSTDDTYKKLSSFSFEKMLIVRKKNGGVSSARNQGILHATGDYILFLDADDFYSYNIFEKLDAVTSTIDLIFFGYNTVNLNDNIIRNYALSDSDNINTLFSKNDSELLLSNFFLKKIYFHICAVAIRRKFIQANNIFFDELVYYGEDIDFIIRAISLTNNIFYIKDILFHYVNRPNSTVKEPVSMSQLTRIDSSEKLYLYFSTNNYSMDLVKKFNFYHLTLHIHLILGIFRKGLKTDGTDDVYDQISKITLLLKRKIKFPYTILGLKCYIFYKILCLIPANRYKNFILFSQRYLK